jgi:GTPase SAR1 family protein
MEIYETDMGLEVVAVDDQLKTDGTIHPVLPQPPFSLMITAPKGSGKSTVISRLIAGVPKRGDKPAIPYYKKFFDRVHIFSPSWRLDASKSKQLAIPDDQIYDNEKEYPLIVEQILLDQEITIEEEGKDKAHKVLLIFTDLAGSNTFKFTHGIFVKLAFNLRHYNVSVIIDSQKYRSINTAFRTNMSGHIFFQVHNQKELEAIREEQSNGLTKDEFNEVYQYSTSRPYSFLYLNYQKPIGERFHRMFNPLRLPAIEKYIHNGHTDNKKDETPPDPPPK